MSNNARFTCRCCNNSTGGIAEYCDWCDDAGCTEWDANCE